MRYFKELIKKLCPDGVQYKKLSELCIALKKGTLKTSDLKVNGKYPVINSGRELYGFYDEFNNKNAITFAARGEYAGFISYFEDEFWAGGLCYPYSSKDEKIITNKFLYYYLKSKEKIIMETLVARGSIPALNKTDLDRFMIAVPPLEVQHEIVNILDTFEEHIECLKKELELRENSYETIMHSLLRKGNFKKFDCLENYCRFEKGKTPIQKNTPGNYPLVATTEHLQTSDNYQFDCEAVCLPLISARGHGVASITRIYYQSGKFALGNILCAIIPKDNQVKAEFLRNYLFYHKDTLLVPLMRGGANVSLTIDSLKKVQIPIPSIEEQQGIIEKLRIFQEILSKEKGIPAEIEKRQQQYEYYREKLLSFKEVEVDE